MNVSFISPGNSDAAIDPSKVNFTVQWYDAEIPGGFGLADILAEGSADALGDLLNLLGYTIEIYNEFHTKVWVGFVDEIVISLGDIQAGLSLKDMYNRIAVAYTTEENGSLSRGTTAWAEVTESIEAYGYKEALSTLADGDLTDAEYQRDMLLAKIGKPVTILDTQSGDGTTTATIHCIGPWGTLGYRFYQNLEGYEAHEPTGSADQAIGQALTATTIGFTRDGRIHDTTGRLNNLLPGSTIEIAGSAGSDGTYQVAISTEEEQFAYTATTISFDPTDDIQDSDENLSFIKSNDFIIVAGASAGANNGTFRVGSAAGNHITVNPKVIITGAAGPSITVTRGNSVSVDPAVSITEFPGNSVTLTVHGLKLAQSFSLSYNSSWDAYHVSIRVRKEGSPTDNLQVMICSDSAGAPGTILGTGTVPATLIPTEKDWVRFTLNTPVTVTYGVTYWLVVQRDGSNSITDFYVVDVDEDESYSGGSLKVWTGAAYVARAIPASLLFRVYGGLENTTQIDNMIYANFQFLAGTEIEDLSGVITNQYRVGDNTVQDEISKLLKRGCNDGSRLIAVATSDFLMRIYKQPARTTDPAAILRADSTLLENSGREWEQGVLPIGKWIDIEELPANLGALTQATPFFCERATYDCMTGKYRLEAQGTQSVYDYVNFNDL